MAYMDSKLLDSETKRKVKAILKEYKNIDNKIQEINSKETITVEDEDMQSELLYKKIIVEDSINNVVNDFNQEKVLNLLFDKNRIEPYEEAIIKKDLARLYYKLAKDMNILEGE